jgi:hypothetical protein
VDRNYLLEHTEEVTIHQQLVIFQFFHNNATHLNIIEEVKIKLLCSKSMQGKERKKQKNFTQYISANFHIKIVVQSKNIMKLPHYNKVPTTVKA